MKVTNNEIKIHRQKMLKEYIWIYKFKYINEYISYIKN